MLNGQINVRFEWCSIFLKTIKWYGKSLILLLINWDVTYCTGLINECGKTVALVPCLRYSSLIRLTIFFSPAVFLWWKIPGLDPKWKKWERLCNQIKACFRFTENSIVLCIHVAQSRHISLSLTSAYEFPTINHWDKAVFPALQPQALNPLGTMTRSLASSFPAFAFSIAKL